MSNLIHEVRNDYTDDHNYTHIDVWHSDDENAEGKSVAIICQDTGKVFFIDNIYRNYPEVMAAIEEVTPKTTIKETAKKLLNELPYEDDNLFDDAALARQVRETIDELKTFLN